MSQQQKHFVFDLETLGVFDNSIVLSMACVSFELDKNEVPVSYFLENSFFCKFSVKEQMALGRDVEQSTLDWWKKQDKEVFKANCMPSFSDVSIKEGIRGLETYLKNEDYDWKTSFLWSRGIGFDFPKIESLCKNIGFKVPFNTFKARDIRTYFDILSGSLDGYGDFKDLEELKGLNFHNALDDCVAEVIRMKKLFLTL